MHDRVQQAAYTLIREVEKKQVHQQVGRLLLQNIKPEELEENIFYIVNQLNIGKDLIALRSEFDELARLNLIAGKKAKSSAAYETALKHLKMGIELLSSDSWKTEYELTLFLYLEAIEAVHLSGNNFELINSWGDRILKQAKTFKICVKVYEIKILAAIKQNNLPRSIETGLLILKQLGVNLSKNPRIFNIFLELLATRFALSIKLFLTGKEIKDLIELPSMTDSYKIAATDILNVLSTATYLANPSLFLLVGLRSFELSINYGNTASSASAYAMYGVILCGLVKEFDRGDRFGKIALNLSEKFKNQKYKSRATYTVNTYIGHWVQSARSSLQNLLETYQIGLETGDLEYACFSLIVYFVHSYLVGKELSYLEREISLYSKTMERFKQETALNYLTMTHQLILNLLNEEQKLSSLIGAVYDERKSLPLHQEAKEQTTIIFYLYFCKLNLAYLFQEYELAANYAALAEDNSDSVRGLFISTKFCFYDSLIKLVLFSQNPQKYKYLLKKVTANQKQMKKWLAPRSGSLRDRAPMNYQHKYDLVAAELHRVRGNKAKAANYYEDAIKGARENEYLNEEAIANELAAKFYLEWDKKKIARLYIIEAHYKYKLWGAIAKVKHLEEHYPDLLVKDKISKFARDYITTISGMGSSRIKLDAIELCLKKTISKNYYQLLENLLLKMLERKRV